MRTSPSARCRAAVLIVVAAIAAAAFAGPVSAKTKLPQPRQSRTYLGKVAGSDAFIAIVARRGVAIAYVCDSNKTAVWLRGTFKNGRVSLEAKDGSTLEGTLTRSSLTLPGESPLKAKTHLSPTTDNEHFIVGVGKAAGEQWVGGWILLANGSQRGALKSKSGPIHTPLPPVKPTTTSVSLPEGGTIPVAKYVKDWERLPIAAGLGGAAE
jgi:hypothetical protein